ncbi:MAG: oligosaccharide flippase family protein [Cyclobacteriaceae bacterium]
MIGKNYWLTSGFFTMLHRGMDFFLGFLGFMILVRIFSPEEFGVWVLLITLIAIVDMARNGFLQNGMIKFLVGKNRAIQAKIQGAALVMNSILTLIFFALIWISASWLEDKLNAPGLSEILKIYSWVLPFLILHSHNLILMQAKYDFRAYFMAGISKSLPFFLVILYYFFSGSNLELSTLAWFQNSALILASLMSIFQVKEHFYISWKWNRYWNKKIFHFGKYVFGTNLMSMLTNSLDKLLLGALLSPIQVAMANTAGRVMNMVEIPVNSIASISYPKASEAFDKAQLKEAGKLYEKTVGLMLSFTFPFWIITLVFAPQIIMIIAGEAYLDAAPFLRVMALLALIKPFDRQSGIFLDAIGKPFLNTIMVFGTFIYGAALSYFLIEIFGLMGAAYGLVLAVLITAIIKQFMLRKFIPISAKHCLYQATSIFPKMGGILLQKLKRS